MPAELLSCLLIYYQQPDGAGRDGIHDYAWAAVQLLIDEGCVALVAPPTTGEREAAVTRGKRGVAAYLPPPSKRSKPQEGATLEGHVAPSVGRVSTPAGGDRSTGEAEKWLVPTKLGLAIFRSSMSPGDGLTVYRDLSGEVDAGHIEISLRVCPQWMARRRTDMICMKRVFGMAHALQCIWSTLDSTCNGAWESCESV